MHVATLEGTRWETDGLRRVRDRKCSRSRPRSVLQQQYISGASSIVAHPLGRLCARPFFVWQLPRGYAVGDAVIMKCDFQHDNGTVVAGDRGEVIDRSPTEPTTRVLCKFPSPSWLSAPLELPVRICDLEYEVRQHKRGHGSVAPMGGGVQRAVGLRVAEVVLEDGMATCESACPRKREEAEVRAATRHKWCGGCETPGACLEGATENQYDSVFVLRGRRPRSHACTTGSRSQGTGYSCICLALDFRVRDAVLGQGREVHHLMP